MNRSHLLALPLAAALAGAAGTGAQEAPPRPVPPLLAESPYDGFHFEQSDACLESLKRHQVAANGKPADGSSVSLWGGARCEWVMPTPQAGDYVVSVFVTSGDRRPGRFGYQAGGREHVSEEFREPGEFSGSLRAFRISVPAGQTETRMFLTGDGLYFGRADISRVTQDTAGKDGSIRELAESSYRTVLRRAGQTAAAPASVVLVPNRAPEREAARALAARLNLPTREEPAVPRPFPAYPAEGLSSDTNLIIVSGPEGGPLAAAMRRAGLFEADLAVPGAGGYVIRTVPRPFRGSANAIVLAASDAAGLSRAVAALQPREDAATRELVWDTFVVDVPGERWAKLRPSYYRPEPGDAWVQQELQRLRAPGPRGQARGYVGRTASWGDRYWRTGDARYAEVFKQHLFTMQDDHIFGGTDTHMELYQLLRAWDRCDEAPVFSREDRLRIANYLLLDCVMGKEGFGRSYSGYSAYSGKVLMRHNHQTILGCGMMQAYLYYSRLYNLGQADVWKQWCDGLIENGTRWGHAPEDSPNYEPITFYEVADMLRYQGLTTKGARGTEQWPEVARRFLASRDSFSLPACYGDCWDTRDAGPYRFYQIMRDDWEWPAAQAAIDRLISGLRHISPESNAAGEAYAYEHGSTEVGGVRPPSDPQASGKIMNTLLGLAAVPMTEGFYQYQTGKVGHAAFWAKHTPAWAPPYERSADKVQYRSGFGVEDEYLLLETLGWANHGHLDLGTIVQYCLGGRLWIVDAGYTNIETRHHSTLEVSRDGQPAWAHFPGERGRWGDFRGGPQMFEIVERTPKEAGTPGPFSVKCRARGLAGATWVRAVSGGGGEGLVIEDTLTADEPGEYQATFRLRLLGEVAGEGGRWSAAQKGARLPVTLETAAGDRVAPGPWEPDGHIGGQGRYPFLPAIANDGRPTTIEWARTVRLERGQTTVFRARLGPLAKE